MSTAEARQAVYERARKAAVAQLSFNQPALSKADIAKECLALEEAIRKVEADAARKSPTQTPAERSATPPAGAPDGGAQAASRPLQRNRADPPPADLPWAGWPTEAARCPRAIVERPIFAGKTSGKRISRRHPRSARDQCFRWRYTSCFRQVATGPR